MAEIEAKRLVLLADDEAAVLAEGFAASFRSAGIDLVTETSPDNVLARIERDQPAAVVLDVLFPRNGQPEAIGLELVRHIKSQYPNLPVVMLTGTLRDSAQPFDEATLSLADFVFAKEALYQGDVGAALRTLIREILEAMERSECESDLDEKLGFYVGRSKAMQKIAQEAMRLARTDLSILLTGEHGSGKEELARSVHRLSSRKDGPFRAVNIGEMLNEDLLQAELFGFERGAHSTARTAKAGLIESTSGGTLFLDEIQAMTLPTQQALLRTLQFKTVRRLGATEDLTVDVRFIAATNADPDQMIEAGKLREDVFQRLAAAKIHLPALRDRSEDIPALVGRFIEEANREATSSVTVLGARPEVLSRLAAYSWPGNIRELRNAVLRAAALTRSNVLMPSLFDQFKDSAARRPAGKESVADRTQEGESGLTWQMVLEMRGKLRRNRLIDFIRRIETETGTSPDGRELAQRLGTSYDNLRRVLSEADISLRDWPNVGRNNG